MENLKRGDIVYWKPDDGPKTKEGKPMSVLGVYLGKNESTGEHVVVDCIAWNGEWYKEGGVFTKGPLGIPQEGLKVKYWAVRKYENNRERLIWEYVKPDKKEGD